MYVLEAIVNVILAIVLPVEMYLSIVGIMMTLDTYFGLGVARRDKTFSFKKLLNGILIKIRLYTPIVVAIYWLDEFAINSIVYNFINIDHLVTRFVTGIILLREGNSILLKVKDKYNFDLKLEGRKLFNFIKSSKKEIDEIK